ncbi:TetR/AcrR family transcriptional regulator [Streptomyces sp. NPDC046977]|uniref:TetR/AcrR family transcriptional regulator n=1 Tax=Streptomyces sp. NPDC046977 TaxID=3154703 RepID=UPI0033D96948
MGVIKTARERARGEVTAAIKEEARRQLADEGAARLSLRSVARELGMVSSALYRYFPNRDVLLTALIVDAYDAVGAAAETAFEGVGDADPVTSWAVVGRAVRGWALEHPHEYALIYGSPVPGYSAPLDTIGPASRVALVLLTVAERAHATGRLALPAPDAPISEGVRADAWRLVKDLDQDLPPQALPALIAAWAQLFGLIGFELFGQFNNVVEARDEFFDHAMAALAHQAGLCSDPVLPGE